MVRLRLPRTTRRFWRGYLTIVVLVGALGGVSLAAAANARRTSSSFATFFASTDPSTLSVIPAPANPNDNYSPAVSAALSRLPGLRHVESAVFVGGYVLNRLGVPSATEFQNTNSWVQGSVDGLYFTQDRLTVLRGRMSNPRSVDEIVVSPLAAARHHLHLGSVVSFGFYTNAQQANASFLKVTASGAPLITPTLTVRARVVGIAQSNTGVVADDVDQREIVLFTPALTHRLLTSDLANTVGWTDYGLQLNGGSAAIAPAQRAVAAALPSKVSLIFQEPTLDETAAARAIAPFTISLVVASLLSALALVLVMLQVVSRLFQAGAREREALRALGASPVMILADDLTGVIASLVLGVMVAVAVAFAASPLAPIGPLRSVFPSRGLYADTPVFALGAVGMLVVLVVLASAAGAAANPARVARRARRRPVRGSGLARAAGRAGLPAPAVEGVRFALVRSRGRDAVPVRSVMFGAALTVFVLTASFTYSSSLASLVGHPSLYGWNFNTLLVTSDTTTLTPTVSPAMAAAFNSDPRVAAWSRLLFTSSVDVDGQPVPLMLEPPRSRVSPPLLSGHEIEAIHQVLVGPETLAALHKRVGDEVTASSGGAKLRVRIVGTATFPATGLGGTLHPALGVGALAWATIVGSALGPIKGCGGEANEIAVRFRAGVSARAARAETRHLAAVANRGFASLPVTSPCAGDRFAAAGLQRPAEIVNYRSMGATPAVVGATLTGASLVALAVALVASVRRRRRDLAVFKSLGFTRRQIAATIAWQSTITMIVGVVVGVPTGVVAGRWMWTSFANVIHVVPRVVVPWLTIGVVVVVALVVANVAAAVPAWRAAATEAAPGLRAE